MKRIIVANWKMNPASFAEASKIFNEIKKKSLLLKKTEVVICPPFVYLAKLNVKKSKIKLGAQDLFWQESSAGNGAYTGEISGEMLKDLGIKYVIAGHSERRKYFNENNEIINKEIKIALKNKLKIIFCVGEKKRDNSRKYLNFIKKEILEGLKNIKKEDLKNIIIAYEPIWAIGSNAKKSDKPEETKKIIKFIKKILFIKFGGNYSRIVPFLYGGSVDKNNAFNFLKNANVQGLLVGRSSLNKNYFSEILKISDNLSK